MGLPACLVHANRVRSCISPAAIDVRRGEGLVASGANKSFSLTFGRMLNQTKGSMLMSLRRGSCSETLDDRRKTGTAPLSTSSTLFGSPGNNSSKSSASAAIVTGLWVHCPADATTEYSSSADCSKKAQLIIPLRAGAACYRSSCTWEWLVILHHVI